MEVISSFRPSSLKINISEKYLIPDQEKAFISGKQTVQHLVLSSSSNVHYNTLHAKHFLSQIVDPTKTLRLLLIKNDELKDPDLWEILSNLQLHNLEIFTDKITQELRDRFDSLKICNKMLRSWSE